jgi:hypothetical protein
MAIAVSSAPSLPPLPPLPADMGSLELDSTRSSSSDSASGMAITTSDISIPHQEHHHHQIASGDNNSSIPRRPGSISSRPRNKKKLGINTNNSNYNYSSFPPPPPSAPPGPVPSPGDQPRSQSQERQLSVSSSQTRLRPMQSHTSSVKTTTTNNKLFSNAIKSLTPQTPSTSTFLKSIGSNAKFFSDPETKQKLHLLNSDIRFDEIMEFGFPPEVVPEPRRGSKATVFSDPGAAKQSTSSDDVFEFNGTTSPLSEYRNTIYGAMTGPREMTLKITLSPPGMRADDETIYGWQKDHIDTGTFKSLKSVDELSPPDPDYEQNNPPSSPSDTETLNTPAKKTGVKRVLGRFKSNKQKLAPNGAMMITSNDVSE